ncbi:DUF6716 putative glycosyltransferase [Synechococcus sp. M16CYN]|uniref:DUF6716 putative glycosyltransferase n=1 Tax=Synechococcus sp. M16CYN TaxID=3103139 RepID=UPI00324AA5A2
MSVASLISERLTGRKVVAVACFDSFGKLAMTLLAACRKEGAETTLHLLELNNRSLSKRQRLEIQNIDLHTPIEKQSWRDLRSLCSPMAGTVDALILSLDGKRSREALLQLQNTWGINEKRPQLISAYPGILFRFALEGMLDRSGADLLCLNSNRDLAIYEKGCKALGLSSSNAVVTGLPILWRIQPRMKFPDHPSIVFFEQPSIPVHPLQRRFLCEQLRGLATAWPEHQVIFKPRTSSIESTLHRKHGEMTGVIHNISRKQTNLKSSFKPVTQLLRKCGCAITVSSTAALESMVQGISTRIVGDLGITETLGNHFFADSGTIANFAAIRSNPFQVLHDETWLHEQGFVPDGENRFINALLERFKTVPPPLIKDGVGPSSWGSTAWQRTALAHGGRKMLSSGGACSSQRKRYYARRILRTIRDSVVGFGWLLRLLQG